MAVVAGPKVSESESDTVGLPIYYWPRLLLCDLCKAVSCTTTT